MSMPVGISEGWDADQVSVAEIEARIGERVEPPPASWLAEWAGLVSRLRDGDELWECGSPAESWEQLTGEIWLVIVRAGRVVHKFVSHAD